jgi:organic radical activating enzyme
MTLNTANWLTTDEGEPRGFIQPYILRELWFHTGTACNLACPFCLEGSKPGDNRLERITLQDVESLMNQAAQLGVEQFSFTGGEPFIVKDFVNILQHAASLAPCLVLTNGTAPVLQRLHQIEQLLDCINPISFRISIDWTDEQRHDAGRGAGSFKESLQSIVALQKLGFNVSLARQMDPNENSAAIDAGFQQLVRQAGFQGDIRIVSFPDFLPPGHLPEVPAITEDCMTRYHNEAGRKAFMCAFSKMVIKKNGRMQIYACTLVDDDPRYSLGEDLETALQQRIILAHHRCYSCFANGSSCSEL